MKNRCALFLMGGLLLQTVAVSMPAMADHFYRHVRHEERKAERQRADARIDAFEGRFGAAARHERKAFRDERRADWY